MRIGVGIDLWGRRRRIPPELAEELSGIPRSKPEWLGEVLAITAIVVNIVLLATTYASLPQSVPTHFGFGGQPTAYAAKGTLLALLGLNIFMYAMMTVLVAFPRYFNFSVAITAQNARRQFLLTRIMVLALKALLAWMIFYLSYQAVAVALGRTSAMGLGIWVFGAVIVLGLPLVFVLSYKWR